MEHIALFALLGLGGGSLIAGIALGVSFAKPFSFAIEFMNCAAVRISEKAVQNHGS